MRISINAALATGGILAVVSGCTAPDQEAATKVIAAPHLDYVAQFNEPFLSFETNGDFVTMTSPEDLDGTKIPVGRDGGDRATMFRPRTGDGSFTLLIERGECFDDMSGLRFSHKAILAGSGLAGLDGFRELTGCARLTTEPQPRE